MSMSPAASWKPALKTSSRLTGTGAHPRSSAVASSPFKPWGDCGPGRSGTQGPRQVSTTSAGSPGRRRTAAPCPSERRLSSSSSWGKVKRPVDPGRPVGPQPTGACQGLALTSQVKDTTWSLPGLPACGNDPDHRCVRLFPRCVVLTWRWVGWGSASEVPGSASQAEPCASWSVFAEALEPTAGGSASPRTAQRGTFRWDRKGARPGRKPHNTPTQRWAPLRHVFQPRHRVVISATLWRPPRRPP